MILAKESIRKAIESFINGYNGVHIIDLACPYAFEQVCNENGWIFEIDLDYNGWEVSALTTNCEYESQIIDCIKDRTEAFYLYRSDDTLAENERYALKGWQSQTDFNNQTVTPELYDLNSLVIRSDLNLYAYYIKENVEMVPMNNRFFRFNQESYDGVKEAVLTIHIDPLYRRVLTGKITLPIEYDNKPIIALGDFQDMTQVTHIYFANKSNSKYEAIANNRGFGSSNSEGLYDEKNYEAKQVTPAL
jgi:hypothetical protein